MVGGGAYVDDPLYKGSCGSFEEGDVTPIRISFYAKSWRDQTAHSLMAILGDRTPLCTWEFSSGGKECILVDEQEHSCA